MLNKEYMKEHNRKGMEALSKRGKISLEEAMKQMDEQMNPPQKPEKEKPKT